MTFTLPFLGLLAGAAIAAFLAYRLGLLTPEKPPTAAFNPPHPHPVPSHASRPTPPASPTHAPPSSPASAWPRDGALVLLIGTFAAYASWMVIGSLVAGGTGLAAWMANSSNQKPGGGTSVEPPLELVARTHLIIGMLSIPVAVAICRWARRSAGQPLDWSVSRGTRIAGQAVLWSLIVLPMVFTIGILASQVSRMVGHPVVRTAHSMLKLIVDETGGAGYRWMLIAVAVAVAPVLEEIIYRGMLQRALMTLTRSTWAAVLATSVLFTAVHAAVIPSGSFWPAASLIFSLSVLMGLLFARTRSVISSMVVHAAFNAVSIAAAVGGW